MNKLPSGWQTKSLGEISESIQYGFTQSSNSEVVGPKFLRITDIQNGLVDWESVPYCNCDEEKFLLKDGDILFARTGATTGKSYLVKNPPRSIFASYLIRVQLSQSIYSPFIFQYFQTKNYWSQIKQNITGSTQGGFNASKLSDLKIPLPSLPIQQQIAKILEKADQAKQKRKEANELTEQFLQSAFIEMFGDPINNPKRWNTEQIGNAIKYSEYGTSKKSNKVGAGYPILSMSNITNDGRIDLTNISYVELNKNEFSKLKLIHGDVVFNRTNSTELIGKTAYWDKDLDFVIASYLVKLQLKPNHNPIWFSYLLNTKYFKNLFALKCKKAVNQSNISPTLLKEFTMYSPPLPLQQQFAGLVQKTEALKEKQKKSETELENLFNTLMQKAFKGELVS